MTEPMAETACASDTHLLPYEERTRTHLIVSDQEVRSCGIDRCGRPHARRVYIVDCHHEASPARHPEGTWREGRRVATWLCPLHLILSARRYVRRWPPDKPWSARQRRISGPVSHPGASF